MTRWMHPPEIERERDRARFDPIAEGNRYRLDRELSLAIWTHACAEIHESTGRHDAEQARRRFHELAARIAARGGRLRPDVGRVTRMDIEAHGGPLAVWRSEYLAPRVPGRQTLVSADAASRYPVGEDLAPRVPGRQTLVSADAASRRPVNEVAPARGLSAESSRTELPGASAVMQAMDALQAPQRQDRVTPLERDLGTRMSRLFAFDVTRVAVVPESPAVTGSTKAVTKGDEVHFRPGAYRPGTPQGDWLIAHELAHVVQQGGRGERTGTRKELEREADRAAHLVARGHTASIRLRADQTAAYAFDEGDAHEPDVEEAQLDKKDDEAAKHAQDRSASADVAKQDASPDAHGAEAAEHDTGAEIDEGDASAEIPAEDALPGPPGVSGGPPARPQKEPPPSVAAAKPEAGLAQMRGVRPDKLGLLFGQVHTAAGADVAQARAKLQANPPRQMSTGGPLAAKGSAASGTTPGAGPVGAGAAKGATGAGAAKAGDATAADPKAHDVPDHPVKGEVPGGESDKQAKQGKAAEQQKSAPQMIASVAQSIASWFGSWFGHGEHGDDANTPKMSDAETRQMSGSLDQLPTTAQGASTDPGPTPKLAMKDDAKTGGAQDRAKLEATTAGLETQGRADSRAPMGEDHIEPAAAPEELTAAPSPSGAAPAAPQLPTIAGAASSEEVGIVAQEQHGVEIDAALTKASADATAERAKHTQEEAKARTESDAHIRELKTTADADQAAARAAAQAEVHEARGHWQAELDKKGSEARKQADRKVSEGTAQVAAEEAKANAEARQHIEEGQRKAEDEKQKGEKEAADAKEKGKKKSSGFFGWLASKAKAAFDGIKKAVHAAIDACRKAIKAVIDAAKKLAMAAIELARKVIVAAIKAVGQALIAISNVLLAAFPALKARFQAAIRKAVDKAVNTVNKLADGLKKAVQKALDMLGAALDKALQLLEKGLDAIIDAANAAVQGAIKAAQAVVEALGTWVKLIKDIASGPVAWLGKLGASVWDGIKNHLWSAFKTAVIDWFKSKVFELLGVGGIILELLLEGGLTKEHIIQMALDALMVAIPAALVSILIEKLVSMIVPAAGAVMAIIEGLQAAWGTISRIIAAFSAFVAFLLAVKGGSAGALFAAVLASAAVVVLDFVANWLLKKLASAARKVGAKLKGLAEKFKAKFKRKGKAGSAGKHPEGNHHDEHGPKKAHDNHDDKKAAKDDKKQAEIQKRVEKAERELPPKIIGLISKRPSRLRVRAQFAIWKLTYKLSRLEIIKGAGGVDHIEAQVNPKINLGSADKAYEFEWSEIAPIFHRVATKYVGGTTHGTDASGAFQYQSRPKGTDASLEQLGNYRTGTHADGTPAGVDVKEKERGFPFPLKGKIAEVRQPGAAQGRMYPDVARDLKGDEARGLEAVDNQALGRYLKAKMRGGDTKLPPLGGHEAAADELFGMWNFEPGHPRERIATPDGVPNQYRPTYGHQRDWTYAMMTADLLEGGHISVQDAILKHPAQGGGAQAGAQLVTAVDVRHTQAEPTSGQDKVDYDKRVKKEIELVEAWVRAKCTGPSAELWATKPTTTQIEAWVEAQIKNFRGY